MGRSGNGKRNILLGWPNLFLKFADMTGHSVQRLDQETHNYCFYAFYPGNLAKKFVNGKDIRSSC